MLQLDFKTTAASAAAEAKMETHELALSVEQPDVLRTGFEGSSRVAEISDLLYEPNFAHKKHQLFRQVASQYGLGAAIRRQADLKVVEQFHRLPGLKSSFLGIEMELGESADLEFSDWMGDNLPQNNRFDCDMHATMEKHLGME